MIFCFTAPLADLILLMRKLISFFIIALFLFTSFAGKANSDENDKGKVTLSGYVHDQTNGELLIGVTVYCMELKTGAVTNMYGFYSLSLVPGKYTIRYSFVGYNSQEKAIRIDKNMTMN